MVRSASCEKTSVVKSGVWIAEDDAKTPTFVSEHGSSNWTSVPKKTGVKRCGKSCRLRLSSYIPDLKHDNFTSEEEDLIVKLHAAIGSRWSIIAQQLPGRTDNDVKNNWNTKLKKKLSQMGIDPVTHKPFSKLIADYGNIGATTTATDSQQRLIRNTNDRSMQLRTKMETSMFEEGCLSSTLSTSSACSSTSTQGTTFVAPFSWNDFLTEDANFAAPTNNLQEEQYLEKKKEVMSSSSDVSFVEAILDQENEMFLSFPELLEEPSNY
ncbi:transcription factor MYB35-like [Trifolium pratense]|uniref:transcription factor MYB35-like n=1 Tax=Trifolium pratense TaxID=57577 RepID=UPI001E69409B|nr:transcription factor MYB35-like [Trifolium pratense]